MFFANNQEVQLHAQQNTQNIRFLKEFTERAQTQNNSLSEQEPALLQREKPEWHKTRSCLQLVSSPCQKYPLTDIPT